MSVKIINQEVGSSGIADGSIVNADVSASAAIAGTKISPAFGAQQITASGSAGSLGGTMGLSFAAAGVEAIRASATQSSFQAGVTGDTVARFLAQADGKILWGAGGSSAADVNLYRDSADNLKTDDSLTVLNRLTSGGRRCAISSVKTGAYTVVSTTDHVIQCNPTGGGFTVELPATHSAGQVYVIKNVTGSTNTITIDPADADTVDGAASITITSAYGVARVISDGTNWFTI